MISFFWRFALLPIIIGLVFYLKSAGIEKIRSEFIKNLVQVLTTGIMMIGLFIWGVIAFQSHNNIDKRNLWQRLLNSKTKSSQSYESGDEEFLSDEMKLEISLIYSENPGQNSEVNKAIAAVIQNRISSNDFEANSITEVINQENQFESVKTGNLEEYGNIDPDVRKKIKKDIKNYYSDQTKNILYYTKKSERNDINDIINNSYYGAVVRGDYVFTEKYPN